jgi:hypothetical protein
MRLAEYDRTILGYHGTPPVDGLRVVQGLEPLSPSTNTDDWLGRGDVLLGTRPAASAAVGRAGEEAAEVGRDVAVLGALLHLGNCFDLLDPPNVTTLRTHYDDYVSIERAAGRPLPVNVRRHKR